MNNRCSSPATTWSPMATTLAAGWPARISLARFGPVSTATGCPGSTSSTTSLMRLRESRSRPLARLTTGTHGRTKPAAAFSTSRKCWDGTPITTTSACEATSSRSDVASRLAGRSYAAR